MLSPFLLIGAIILLAVLTLLARSHGPREPRAESAHIDRFGRAQALLTDNERAFYLHLVVLLEPRYRLFAKVCLRDLVSVIGGPGSRAALNQVSQKHVDFVACEPGSTAIVAVIELDDASHADERRATSDTTKNIILGHVGIPLIRVKARRSYGRSDVAADLSALLSPGTADVSSQARTVDFSATPQAAKPCPRCGSPLIERRSKSGERFIGCTGFPACRHTEAAADGRAQL